MTIVPSVDDGEYRSHTIDVGWSLGKTNVLESLLGSVATSFCR
jgi:hypothetical protein